MFWILLCLLVAVFSCAGTLFYSHCAIKLGIFDHPTDRGSHSESTPRGGGLVFVVAILASTIVLFVLGYFEKRILFLSIACVLVALVGFFDDIAGVTAKKRLIVHFISSGVVILIAVENEAMSLGLFSLCVIALIFGVWLINLYNFMDGIDGLAAMQSIFVSSVVAGMLWLNGFPETAAFTAICALSILGFFVFNFPPARIFMGDVGSGFLGALIIVYGVFLIELGPHGILVLMSATAVFVVDASSTLISRIVRGYHPTEPHRSHMYQRLVRVFGSHRKTLLCYTFVNIVLVLPVCIWQIQTVGAQWTSTIYLYIILSAIYTTLAVRVPE